MSVDFLLQRPGHQPDWDAAEQVIRGVAHDMAERMRSDSWGTRANDLVGESGPGGADYLVVENVQQALREDLKELRDAFDSPPDGLWTATFDDGTLVHKLDETTDAMRSVREASDRLSDFGVLQANGYVPGTW